MNDMNAWECFSSTATIIRSPEAETYFIPSVSTSSHTHKSRTQVQPSPASLLLKPPLEIYTAYTHADKHFYAKIEEQFAILQKQKWPISCHEDEISYSTSWQRSGHLKTAHLIVLLVSSTFLKSDFCYCEQMYLAVERHKKREELCYVIPVILRPLHQLLLERTPFATVDFLPANGKPISKWSDADQAYTEITGYLLEKIKYMAYYL